MNGEGRERAREGSSGPGRVTCFGCRHLVTTYEPAFPYACRLFGMKSRLLPSIEVHASSGEDCRGYEARERGRPTG